MSELISLPKILISEAVTTLRACGCKELAGVLEAYTLPSEWSAYRRGPGSGPMFSGGDGAKIPACAECGGLDPNAPWQGNFVAEAVGHRSTCSWCAKNLGGAQE